MAHHAWPIHRLPRVHSCRCRDCPRLGLVSGAAAQAMLNAQAVCNYLDVACIHRLFDRAVFAALGGVSAAFYVEFVEIDTMKNKLLALGVGGTILAALCCFTPLLPVVVLESKLTCPSCGHVETETMPTDACQWFYECKSCQTVLKPLEGDCCVYCSYATVQCPPIQEGKSCC